MPLKSHEDTIGNGELLNKRIIICTITGLAAAFGLTTCAMALMGRAVPEGLNTLTISTLSGIMGFLAKTGIDAKFGTPAAPMIVTNPDGEALVTTDKSEPDSDDKIN